ncbi:MAG: diaminopimelate decarboxylase [Actinobacteria bacterium]|nr:diaminopimelate decarboxylase [Actinomycetota bacterium]
MAEAELDRSARSDAGVADPWPTGAVFGARGLEIAGVSAADLAARHGTPLLVVDEDDFRSRCRAAAAAWPRAFFAVKAFPAYAAIRIAMEEGLDLLASTGGEVEACLRAGAPGERVSLHGNDKSAEELELAVREGLGLVVLDNSEEVARLSERARAAGTVRDVLVRVVPEILADTHEAIATGHEASKFGVPLLEAVGVARAAAEAEGLRFAGIHAHVGSQLLDAEVFLREAEVLVGLLARLRDEAGLVAELLDLGGGFGITYTDERPVPIAELGLAVRERVGDACARRGLAVPTVAAEPGRSLIGPAAVTLYSVGTVKTAAGRRLVAVDGGMSDNPRPVLYDARYEVALASSRRGAAVEPATIVGRHCESGDVLAEGVLLPADLARGDVLAFAATGAYTYSMASNYNRVGRPAVLAVRVGETRRWLRREDAGDLERLETSEHRREPDASVPPGISIRPARPRDARSFLEFWRAIVEEGGHVRSESVRHPPRVYRARFRRAWTGREAQIVAADGERVVGHVFIQRDDHPITRHVATLGIAVAADLRGKGVGTALMSEALRWARSSGVEKVVLSVYPGNTAAIALYRRFGFVQEGRLAGHSRKSYGYEDEILMATWLGGER